MNEQRLRATRPRRRRAATAVLAGALLLVAACGSTGSTSGSSSPAQGGSSSAATGSPILIGGQGDLVGAPGVADGFDARIAAANKAGGIDGHPIKFVGMLDDAFSPQTNLTNSQKLVESDN